jgi:hypothetical protein
LTPNLKIAWKQSVIDTDAAADAALAEYYSTHHAILLRDALDQDFLKTLTNILMQSRFLFKPVPKIGERTVESPGLAGKLLRDALMRPPLSSWLEKVTGCGPVHSVAGTITRYSAGSNDHLDWHHDSKEGRLLAITVNLGNEPYEGGEFEMRPRHSPDLLLRHQHSEPGMALIFRVTRDLFHRVLPITGGGPRTVFSGWFLNKGSSVNEARSDS